MLPNFRCSGRVRAQLHHKWWKQQRHPRLRRCLTNLVTQWFGWWARQDLNLGPMDYESTALTAELRARWRDCANILQYLTDCDRELNRPAFDLGGCSGGCCFFRLYQPLPGNPDGDTSRSNCRQRGGMAGEALSAWTCHAGARNSGRR
jgi:hypothetical protein